MAYVYILKSLSFPRQLYVGVTTDLSQRLNSHNTGRCAHTSRFMPWEIIYTESFEDKASALKRERQIKGWSRAKKEALIAGERGELRNLARRRVF